MCAAPAKPLKALLIEDSELDALLLEEQLRAGGYEPHARRVDNARDLREALKEKWDIIFSDHSMPQFNSTEALRIVRSTDVDTPFLIVSGSIGEEAAVQAMKAGAQDYLMKGNLTRLVAAVDRELKEVEERRARRAAERALLAQQEEFRLAREVQQQLFPAGAPTIPGYDLAGFSCPAAATGGDYYDFIPTPNGDWFVVIGDVTGHGLGPALLMADARAYLRALALTSQSLEQILTEARHLLLEDLGLDRFISLLCARLRPTTGEWEYINAGHPPAFLFDAHGQLKSEWNPTTAALGIDRTEEALQSVRMTAAPGDMLLMLTDGILEARSAADEDFGEERARHVVCRERNRRAEEILQILLEEARRFSADPANLQDDMTAIIVKHGAGG